MFVAEVAITKLGNSSNLGARAVFLEGERKSLGGMFNLARPQSTRVRDRGFGRKRDSS